MKNTTQTLPTPFSLNDEITILGKVYFAECGIYGRCILRNENLRKMMMLLLLLSFVIVCVHRL